MKDMIARYFVPTKIIVHTLAPFFKETQLETTYYLLKHLVINEFKRTKDCKGTICFLSLATPTSKRFLIF